MPLGDYQSMLASAQNSYKSMIQGYNSALSNQVAGQQAVEGGYSQLYHDVLSGIKGVGTSQSQAIADTYSQRAGSQMQGLINAGLGNTTVQQSVGRGLTLDEEKAQIALSNQVSQLYAGYQSQLGLAGLNYRGQAVQNNAALQGQQLGAMGNYARDLGGWAMQGYSLDAQLRANQMRQAGLGGGTTSSPGGGGFGGRGGYQPGANVREGRNVVNTADRNVPNPAGDGGAGSMYGIPGPITSGSYMPVYTPGGAGQGSISGDYGLGGALGYQGFGGEESFSQGWGALPENAQSYVGGGDQ